MRAKPTNELTTYRLIFLQEIYYKLFANFQYLSNLKIQGPKGYDGRDGLSGLEFINALYLEFKFKSEVKTFNCRFKFNSSVKPFMSEL